MKMDVAFDSATPEPEAAPATPPATGSRTRRSLLTAGLAAAGAFVAQALGRPAPVAAADVVLGSTNNTTNTTTIQNTSTSASAKAIVGKTTFTGVANTSRGVMGISAGENGVGVYGEANKGLSARGVAGASSTGVGVRATGGHTGAKATGTDFGLVAEASGATGVGVQGTALTNVGVQGTGGPVGAKGSGANYGVYGESTDNYGVYGKGGYTGVYGEGPYGTYGAGTTAGSIGTSGPGYGLYGLGAIGAVGIGNGNGYGAWGYNSDSGGYGVVGQGGYRGMYGSGGNAGVYGTSGYVGVWGNASTTEGLNFGVYGYSGSASGYAGVFSGAVQVSGFLSKLGGGFKIDHPMEPADRYLVHSFVEAPEMLNVYSGTVKLDSKGQARVGLPRYVEKANSDFRYQLTPIGAAAPELHVASRVKANGFTIAGGTAGLEVSWQVTGVRQDAWAKANPMETEPLKNAADRGKYLQPQLYGKAAEAAIYALPAPSGKAPTAAPARITAQPAVVDPG